MSNQISDHKATYVFLKIIITFVSKGDYARLNNSIEQYDWDSIINDNISVYSACETFTDIFLTFCKECIPRKKSYNKTKRQTLI